VFQEIVTLRLGGFIFFGSALQLLSQVKKAVLVPLHDDNLWTDRCKLYHSSVYCSYIDHHHSFPSSDLTVSSPSLRSSNGTSQRSSPTMGTVKSLLALEVTDTLAIIVHGMVVIINDIFMIIE
jgi:hypothetical protein